METTPRGLFLTGSCLAVIGQERDDGLQNLSRDFIFHVEQSITLFHSAQAAVAFATLFEFQR